MQILLYMRSLKSSAFSLEALLRYLAGRDR